MRKHMFDQKTEQDRPDTGRRLFDNNNKILLLRDVE
jgi:hypothetical protein